MSKDVKEENEIKASPMFSFQVNESTDLSLCAQLLVFVRYIYSGHIKEKFLFCGKLDNTKTGADFKKMMTAFFKTLGLQWKNVCGVCTDGAPAILGSRSGFVKKVKQLAPEAKGTHCITYRYALASKSLPTALQKLDSMTRIVNFIKAVQRTLQGHKFNP